MAKNVIAAFTDDPNHFLEMGESARKHGFNNLDAVMPYPVHGFEEALGLKKSWVPSLAKFMLVVGAGLGLLFQGWTSAIDWPINVGGKPLFSWPAFIPIVFECGVLLAGITTFFSIMHVARLFPGKDAKMFRESLTNDEFALIVPVKGNGSAESIAKFFKDSGIEDVHEIEH